MVKVPLSNSFSEKRDARRKFSESLGAGAPLTPSTRQRIPLGSENDWKFRLRGSQSWKAASLSLGVVAPTSINKYRMRYVGLGRDNLRSHFVFRPRHAPEWLRAWFLPVVFLANEEELTGKTFTTSLNTTNPNTNMKFIFLRTFPLKIGTRVRRRACSAGVKSSLMKIDFPFRRVRAEVNSFRTFVDVNLTNTGRGVWGVRPASSASPMAAFFLPRRRASAMSLPERPTCRVSLEKSTIFSFNKWSSRASLEPSISSKPNTITFASRLIRSAVSCTTSERSWTIVSASWFEIDSKRLSSRVNFVVRSSTLFFASSDVAMAHLQFSSSWMKLVRRADCCCWTSASWAVKASNWRSCRSHILWRRSWMNLSSFAAFPDDDCLNTFDCPVRGDNDSPAFLFDAIPEIDMLLSKTQTVRFFNFCLGT